jgi:hypothetical protein
MLETNRKLKKRNTVKTERVYGYVTDERMQKGFHKKGKDTKAEVDLRAVLFKLFCSRTPRCNYSSTLYPQSCCSVIQDIQTKTNKLRGLSPQANYTNRDCLLSAKLVPTFADRGVLRSQRGGSPTAVISVF